MGVFKPSFLEIPMNAENKNFRIVNDDVEIDETIISPEEKKQLLDDLHEKLRVSQAQSESGIEGASLDEAMEKLRIKRHERNL